MDPQLLLEIKGTSACQTMHYGSTEWALSIESMLLALKVPRRRCTDSALEPQWQFGANHSSLVAYRRITAVSKLHLSLLKSYRINCLAPAENV